MKGKLVVTGATGFIGLNFIRYMLKNNKDISIVGINRVSNQRNIKRLEDAVTDPRFTMFYADFARDNLTDAFDGAEYVVHLGAKTFVDYSIANPQPFIESNIVGTYRILEEMRKSRSIKKFLQFSTDEVYGSILEGAYKEDARLNPSNPYAATKAAGDMLTVSYTNTYKLPLIISRAENVYGYYQGKEKVFPTFVKKGMNGEPLPVFGDGKHVRQWCHINDVCTAIVKLLEDGKPGDIYHIAGNQELQNIELAKRMLKVMGLPENFIAYIQDHNIRPGHDRRYCLSNEKLKALGWKPEYDLDKGIPDVVKWYMNNRWWFE